MEGAARRMAPRLAVLARQIGSHSHDNGIAA